MHRAASSNTVRQFPYMVVGGGASGAFVAGRLGLENLPVALLEEGVDVTRAARWHREAPAAPLIHRATGRYTASREALLADNTNSKVKLHVPSVVGGAGIVLGSKAYIRGHELDWRNNAFPLPFEDGGLLLQYKRLEAVDNADKHRGTSGRFLVTKSKGVSQIYRDILTGVQKSELGLVNCFNGARGFLGCGAGRSEALIDFANGIACNSVNQYLCFAQQMKRPVTVVPHCKVTKLHFNSSGFVQGVTVIENGSATTTEYSVTTSLVLAAGALASPQLLLASDNLPAATAAAIAQGHLYTSRTRTLRFQSALPITIAPASNYIVQAMIGMEWYWSRVGWLGSSYDDMVCFVESAASRRRRGSQSAIAYNEYPDIKITVQPFLTDERGALLDEHGVQFKVQVIRPTGTGSVSVDEVHVAESQDDLEALEEGVKAIYRIVDALTPNVLSPGGTPFEPYDSWDGPFIGTLPLGRAVDPHTFLLAGTSNVFVTDGSIIPHPVVAEPVALSYALSDLCADRVARKAPSII